MTSHASVLTTCCCRRKRPACPQARPHGQKFSMALCSASVAVERAMIITSCDVWQYRALHPFDTSKQQRNVLHEVLIVAYLFAKRKTPAMGASYAQQYASLCPTPRHQLALNSTHRLLNETLKCNNYKHKALEVISYLVNWRHASRWKSDRRIIKHRTNERTGVRKAIHRACPTPNDIKCCTPVQGGALICTATRISKALTPLVTADAASELGV